MPRTALKADSAPRGQAAPPVLLPQTLRFPHCPSPAPAKPSDPAQTTNCSFLSYADAPGIKTLASDNIQDIPSVDTAVPCCALCTAHKGYSIAMCSFDKTEDAGLKQMVHLLKEYEAAPVADEQMRELFTMGFHDKNL